MEVDLVEAVKCLKLAIEKGNGRASQELGDCYKNGVGVEKNEKEAFKHFLVAANKGNKQAQNEVGDCYQFGRGTEVDLDEAISFYELAAKKKFKPARNSLKHLEERREGISKRLHAALPSWCFCPITHNVMKDPVICEDGNSYERNAIETWLKQSYLSPMSNLPLLSRKVTANFNLKQVIRELKSKIPQDQLSMTEM